jgi:hypothetical protein
MIRIAVGLVILLLAWPALADDDKPKEKDKPMTPAEQYKALDKEYDDAMQAFQKAYGEAKTDEDKQKLFTDKYPRPDKFAPKFLKLAEEHPKDAAALDALVWIVTHNTFGPPGGKDSPRAKAVAILTRDHVGSDKLGSVCQMLVYSNDKESETLLRTLLEKSPHKDVQGQACLALAQNLKNRGRGLPNQKDNELPKEVEELFERAVAKYADVKMQFYGTVGDKAKAELFEIRNLAIGKTAPDIEGVDQDGKKFRLSDYKGKVVLLDFWSQF